MTRKFMESSRQYEKLPGLTYTRGKGNYYVHFKRLAARCRNSRYAVVFVRDFMPHILTSWDRVGTAQSRADTLMIFLVKAFDTIVDARGDVRRAGADEVSYLLVNHAREVLDFGTGFIRDGELWYYLPEHEEPDRVELSHYLIEPPETT